MTGARRNGDNSQGLVNVIPFVYHVHDSLALGATGDTLLRIAALPWFVDGAVTVVLTFPARATPRRTPFTWLLKWREAWGVRRRANAFRLQFDMHRAAGLWPWPVMVVLALSGIAFNLPQVYRPVLRTLGPYDSVYEFLPDASPPAREPALDLRAGYAAAKAAMRAAALREGVATTQIYVNADSGARLALDLPSRRGAGHTSTESITNLHTAKVFGCPAWQSYS